MDLYRNPVIGENNQGQRIAPSWNNEFGVQPSHQIIVDSRVRDINTYPSAADFAVDLQMPLKSIYSLELLCAIVPVDPAATENWVSLDISDANTNETALSHQGGVGNRVYDDSIVQIPLISETFGPSAAPRDVAIWRRNEKRAIKFYKGRKGKLQRIRFRLNLATPTNDAIPYPAAGPTAWDGSTAPEHNVLYTLDIVSQN